MNVQEAQAAKAEAERKIATVIDEFSEKTGLTVDNVSVSRLDATSLSDAVPKFYHRAYVMVRL